MINLGFARTSEGGFYGVDVKGNDGILLCCNKSVYDSVSGNEEVIKIVEAVDLCEILKSGDYVNGYKIDEINVQGRLIHCDDYKVTLAPEHVVDVITKERFESSKFVIQNAVNRAKELDNINE